MNILLQKCTAHINWSINELFHDHTPLTKPSGFEIPENHADKFTKGGGVRRLHALCLAVVDVEVIEHTARQTYTITRLEIL